MQSERQREREREEIGDIEINQIKKERTSAEDNTKKKDDQGERHCKESRERKFKI